MNTRGLAFTFGTTLTTGLSSFGYYTKKYWESSTALTALTRCNPQSLDEITHARVDPHNQIFRSSHFNHDLTRKLQNAWQRLPAPNDLKAEENPDYLKALKAERIYQERLCAILKTESDDFSFHFRLAAISALIVTVSLTVLLALCLSQKKARSKVPALWKQTGRR